MTKIAIIEKPFVDYSDMSHAEFTADIEAIFSKKDADLIEEAYNLLKYGHRNQKRDGGRRYFDHPKQVAIILYKEFGVRDAAVIIAALLHDIVEDTFILSLAAIERLFGRRVAAMVRILSKLPKKGYNPRLEEFGEIGAWLIKLADNLHNTRTLGDCTPEKKIRKIAETRNHYFRLINLLREKLAAKKKVLANSIQQLFDEAVAFQEAAS